MAADSTWGNRPIVFCSHIVLPNNATDVLKECIAYATSAGAMRRSADNKPEYIVVFGTPEAPVEFYNPAELRKEIIRRMLTQCHADKVEVGLGGPKKIKTIYRGKVEKITDQQLLFSAQNFCDVTSGKEVRIWLERPIFHLQMIERVGLSPMFN